MTNGEQPEPQNGQLREEAATWWAVMHGPDAEVQREEFEAWLDRGSYHRSAYNRMGEIHALGKHLMDDPDLATSVDGPAPRSRLPRKYLLPVAIFASGLLVGSWSYRQATTQRLIPPVEDASSDTKPYQRIASQTFSTQIGEVRTIGLDDGTKITLDTDSLIAVSYRPDARLLRLQRGRARIAVGADQRPFKLLVGSRSVVASRATLDAEQRTQAITVVHMVTGDANIGPGGEQPGIALAAGQTATIDPATPAVTPVAEPTSTWPTGTIDVDRMSLADLVTASNRYSKIQIVLASADLGALRVSGRFRINDTRALAQRLASLFDLRVDTSRSDRITLHM